MPHAWYVSWCAHLLGVLGVMMAEVLSSWFEPLRGGACSSVWERPLLWNSTGSTKALVHPRFALVSYRGHNEGSD